MTQIKTRSFWKVASLLLLATLILSPTAIVSADEVDIESSSDIQSSEQSNKKFRHPRLGEVLEIDTEANTIVVKAVYPKWSENETERIVLITYLDDTVIKQDKEDADETAIEVGEKIIVRGARLDIDSDEYFAQVEADFIHVFDELQPKHIWKHRAKPQIQE